MSIFTRLISRATPAPLSSPQDWLINLFGGGATKSGVSVDATKSLSLTPLWSAILIISRAMGTFPLHIYRELDAGGKQKTREHYAYKLLRKQPNKYLTPYKWRQIMAINEHLHGAGISEIEYDGNGYPVALWPIPTRSVSPKITANGELVYSVTDSKGVSKVVYPEQLIIFTLFPSPTTSGGWLSPIDVLREPIGSALAVREFGARMFGQGVNPAGVVSGVAKAVNEDSLKTLRARFADYGGLGESHRLMLLESGEKFERIGLPPEDAQYLETRRFDISEIARAFCVPLFMLQDHEKSTSWGTGLSEQKDAFVTMTTQPLCTEWEQEIDAKLVSIDDDKYYCKFAMDAVLRGNIKDRTESYKTGLTNGYYTLNDVLSMEDMNPIEGEAGEARFVQMNMHTVQDAIIGKGNENAKTDS
jgi:HK97 family phage portal protein